MAEAGWHPDPKDPTLVRYWTGSQWTEHTAPNPNAAQPAPQQFNPQPAPQQFNPQPLTAVQPAAPVKKKSKVLWILGGIVLFLILVVGSCVAFFGSAVKSVSDEMKANDAKVVTPAPADGTSSGDADPSGAGTKDNPLPIGTEVDLGNGWKVKVVSADLSPEAQAAVLSANEFNPPPEEGMRYILVNLEATYAGTEDAATAAPFSGFSYSVFGSAAVERDNFSTPAVAPDPELDTFAELAAGGVAAGNVVVAVGADETGLALRITPSFSFDETEAWIALG